jgi:cobalamin biosynthesis Mg chelatase CobN
MERLVTDCTRNLTDLCAKRNCSLPPDSWTLWDAARNQVGISLTSSCNAKIASYMKVCGLVKDALLAGSTPKVSADYVDAARQASATMAASSAAAAAKAEAAAKLQQSTAAIRSTAATMAASSAAAAAKAEAADRDRRRQQILKLAIFGGGVVAVGAGIYWFVRRG